MNFIDTLKAYLNDIISEKERNTNEEAELEVRFGTFINNRFYPEFSKNVLANLIKNSSANKSCSFIVDTIFTPFAGLKENGNKINKRVIYDSNTIDKELMNDIFDNLQNLNKEKLLKKAEDIRSKKSKPFYLSKNKKVVNDIPNNLRLTYAIEKKHKLTDLLNQFTGNDNSAKVQFAKHLIDIDLERIKFRCSWKEKKFWRIDSTIVLTVNKKTNDVNMVCEMEIEFDAGDNEPIIENIISEISELITDIKTTINNSDNEISIEDEIRSNISNQVVTLERDKLAYLSNSEYTVTDKADGIRNFIHINELGQVYLINPKTYETILLYEDSKLIIKNCVIDGEFLSKSMVTTNIETFLCFDAIYYNGKDIRGENLKKRLYYGKKIIRVLPKLKIFKIQMKKFYFNNIYKESKRIWENREELFEYHLDGLIFTPVNATYESSLPILKWKDKVSIDVRVIYDHRRNFTEFHAHGWERRQGNKVVNAWYRHHGEPLYKSWIKINNQLYIDMGLLNNRGLLGFFGKQRGIRNMEDIVEFEFNMSNSEWKFVRPRPDKDKPNARRTIESALKAIAENITIDEISQLFYEPSIYSQLENETDIDPIGIQYDSITGKGTNEKRMNWRFFQNSVKRNLFNQTSNKIRRKRKYLMDIGCGRGGDLNKWLEAGYTDILCFDPSGREIYGKMYSEGFNGLIERIEGQKFKLSENKLFYESKYNGNNIKITPVWADGTKDLISGSAGYNSYEKQKLVHFFKMNKSFSGFDTISIMFVIHYLFATSKKGKMVADKKRFEVFMNNVTRLINPKKGILIGAYLTGERIISKVEDGWYIQRDNMNRPFYGINVNKTRNTVTGNEETYDKYWKKKPKMIGIKQSIWGWKNTINEPMIFEKSLDLVFRHHNLFSIKKDVSFESFYNDYTSRNNKNKLLSLSEKNISLINNVFMYQMYPDFGKQNFNILKKN